jgi:putative RNA 2'-phosphotransferase
MMNERNVIEVSKYLSYVLRHRPDAIGIALDDAGWVAVDALLDAMRRGGKGITREQLQEVVDHNSKKRFALSPDGRMIRASQGHSIEIDLAYEPLDPPEILFHGTATGKLKAILECGLVKGRRHHVHLSLDRETAIDVGGRHGRPVVLRVRAGEMAQAGHRFFCSANGVWLVDAVPPEFLEEAME